MILDTLNGRAGSFGSMERSQTGNEDAYRREALEFVQELAGPRPVPVVPKDLPSSDAVVFADQLPVPMFAVDCDMRCVLWNKRATDLTGWTEADLSKLSEFASSIFSIESSSCHKDVEDVFKGALEGQDASGEIWSLKTKWEQTLKVLLFATSRADPMGTVSGAICVIVPLPAPGMQLECSVQTIGVMHEVSRLDLEEDPLSTENYSPRGSEDQFLAAFEQPPSPYSDGGVDAIELFCDPLSLVSEAEGTSVCSQDWCKSEQGSHNLVGAGSGLDPSTLSSARVMVLDPRPRGRRSLTLMLERCGFEVSGTCSGQEAVWRFEQSMQDPESFTAIFMDLSVARADDYEVVRDIRNMEQVDASLTTPVLIVAVTDLDRWDLANMEDSTQKGVAAGVDAVINPPTRVQQLRDTLTNLGVSIDHLDFSNKSPRAALNSWNNPLILAR